MPPPMPSECAGVYSDPRAAEGGAAAAAAAAKAEAAAAADVVDLGQGKVCYNAARHGRNGWCRVAPPEASAPGQAPPEGELTSVRAGLLWYSKEAYWEGDGDCSKFLLSLYIRTLRGASAPPHAKRPRWKRRQNLGYEQFASRRHVLNF